MLQGCRLLVVASRSGGLPADALAELAAAGCTMLAVQADSSDAAAVQRVLDWAREELPHIQHFAHAAGVSGFALLQDVGLQEFLSVTDVKVRAITATGCTHQPCPAARLTAHCPASNAPLRPRPLPHSRRPHCR